MEDASALITAAKGGDTESLRGLLDDLQRSLRVTAAIFLPTMRDVDAVVQRLGPVVANALTTAPVDSPLPWLRGHLRALIVQRLNELEQAPAYAGDPLGRLLLSSGRERLGTVPADTDPVSALTGRLRFMAKGATDLLALRFTNGVPLAQIAEHRHLSLDDVSLAVQTACRQLDWTGDASGGALEPADYRAIDGLVCGSGSTIEGLGFLRARVLDDMGLALRAVRAARWHLIAAAWHAPALTLEIPALVKPLPTVNIPARPATNPQIPIRAGKSRGFSTPTRRQLALRGEGVIDAPSLDAYPEPRSSSALVPTLIGGALVLGGVLLLFLRGGTSEVHAAKPVVAPSSTKTQTQTQIPPSQLKSPAPSQTTVPTVAPPVAVTMKALFVPGTAPTPVAAWSTRLVVGGYSGPLLRVRRSGDHAEKDVGFTTNGSLDTATMTSFTSRSSAHVMVWYDQSGNQHHLRQNDREKQPTIIRDGALDVENSRPVINFNRSRFDHLSTPAGIPIGCLYALVKVVPQGDGTQAIMGSRSDFSSESDAYYPIVDRSGKGVCEWWVGQTKDYTILSNPITPGRMLLWHSSLGGNDRRMLTLRLDGKEVAKATAAHETLVPTGPTIVGGLYWADQFTDPFGGSLGELIVLPPDSSSQIRSTITTDLKKWWKTP